MIETRATSATHNQNKVRGLGGDIICISSQNADKAAVAKEKSGATDMTIIGSVSERDFVVVFLAIMVVFVVAVAVTVTNKKCYVVSI
jgi:hypothetical protein